MTKIVIMPKLLTVNRIGNGFEYLYDKDIRLFRLYYYSFTKLNTTSYLYRIPFVNKYIFPMELVWIVYGTVVFVSIFLSDISVAKYWPILLINLTITLVTFTKIASDLHILIRGTKFCGVVMNVQETINQGDETKDNYIIKDDNNHEFKLNEMNSGSLKIGERIDVIKPIDNDQYIVYAPQVIGWTIVSALIFIYTNTLLIRESI